MNWNNVHEVTAENEKPAPGWLFREICQDAEQHPQDVSDLAEYLMRCAACDSRTVCMKACLTIRHLAEDVLVFRQYMQRCPEALAMLKEVSQPPQLAQAASLERPEAKVAREAAARAWKACLSTSSVAEQCKAAEIKQKIQGFGNFEPPPEEQPERQGAAGVVDKVAGFVGDAVADTVDDFREKGAVGAVRDGIADAADLILDGVGAVWDFLGGKKKAAEQEPQDRICRPMDQRGPPGMPMGFPGAGGGFVPPMGGVPAFMPQAGVPMAPKAPMPQPKQNAFAGAFGQGAVGASYSFSPDLIAPTVPPQLPPYMAASSRAPAPAPAVQETVAAAPAPPADLMDFDDVPSPRGSSPTADLLSFDGDASGSSASRPTSQSTALKNQGNDLVREKKHAEAVKAYEAALAVLAQEEPTEATASVLATLHANIALCYLRQQLYRRAVEAASSSIAADATHAKAYYRRCLAYRSLKMYPEAQRDLEALQFCKHELSAAEMSKLRNSLVVGSGPADV